MKELTNRQLVTDHDNAFIIPLKPNSSVKDSFKAEALNRRNRRLASKKLKHTVESDTGSTRFLRGESTGVDRILKNKGKSNHDDDDAGDDVSDGDDAGNDVSGGDDAGDDDAGDDVSDGNDAGDDVTGGDEDDVAEEGFDDAAGDDIAGELAMGDDGEEYDDDADGGEVGGDDAAEDFAGDGEAEVDDAPAGDDFAEGDDDGDDAAVDDVGESGFNVEKEVIADDDMAFGEEHGDDEIGFDEDIEEEFGDDDFEGDDEFGDDDYSYLPGDDNPDMEDFLGEAVEPVPLSNCHNSEYTAYIAIGKPRQFFQVAMDLTSGDSWVPSADCKNCNDAWNAFDGSKSNSYQPGSSKKNKNAFETKLVSGETLSGTKAVDMFQMGDYKINQQMFGQISSFPDGFSQCENAEGRLGLGFLSLQDDNDFPPVIENFAKTIKNRVFSMYLPSHPDDYMKEEDVSKPIGANSMLVLGGVSQRHYSGCLKWSKVTTQGSDLNNYWGFEVKNIQVGFKSIHSKISTAILDITSPAIVGNTNDIIQFIKANDGVCYTLDKNGDVDKDVDCEGDEYDIATIPCDAEDFAPLQFKLNKDTFLLDRVDMITYAFTDDGGEARCSLRVMSDPDIKFWVFGVPWFNKYYTAFNVGSKEVGFAAMATDEEIAAEEVDVCEKDMPLDVDVKEELEVVEELEEDLEEEVEDIVDEEEEIFEDAEETMEEVFDEVEEELEELDDDDYEYGDDDDIDDDDDFELVDDNIIEEEQDDIFVPSGEDDPYIITETEEASLTSPSASETESKIGAELPMSTKQMAQIGGIIVLLGLVVMVIVRRRRYSGRSAISGGEAEMRRGPFDGIGRNTEDDGKRFVID